MTSDRKSVEVGVRFAWLFGLCVRRLWTELLDFQIAMRVCHQLGKAAFQRHNDPLDAALFYLAMKKKAVLWGLFRYAVALSWLEVRSCIG